MALRKLAHVSMLSVLLIPVLAACGGRAEPPMTVPAGAQPETLVDLHECTYTALKLEYRADCGTLVVPENRSDPASALIALPVIRVRALHDNPAEPIFYLQGGPGGTNLEFQRLADLVDDRDFIQVGYRGVDGSVVLDCEEIADAVGNAPGNLLGDGALDAYTEAAARCAARLEAAGIDVAGYTMTEVIGDMEAARRTLGYDRINLLGESYGTRLEMIYEWMHPQVIHRAVMLAVNPPGHLAWDPNAVDAQLADYSRLCARDARCSARTDDLLASMRHVSESMPERWLFFPIDAGGVKLLTFVMLMETIQPAGAPVPIHGPAAVDMWLAAEQGDYSGMAMITMARSMLASLFVYGEFLSKGASGGDFEGYADDDRTVFDPPGAILGSPFSLYHWSMVRGWPVHLVPEPYRSVQTTDVETLLIGGNMDFSTPPQFAAKELLPYLSKGHQVILDDMGHTESFWQSQHEARRRLLTTYFSTGEVDASLYVHQDVDFDVGLGWPGLAKVAAALILGVVLLVAAIIWLVARRVRGRTRSR
jgi:pimeloyl-ACP methyl ester carboxylesterase